MDACQVATDHVGDNLVGVGVCHHVLRDEHVPAHRVPNDAKAPLAMTLPFT
jgi:hypothetical protein